jgi:HSP20 family protein
MTVQQVPVNIYIAEGRIIVAAPMPGLEAGNIRVTVRADQSVELTGSIRGVRQEYKPYLHREWEAGPYQRTVRLPQPVDGTLANVTYGNGVVVAVLPTVPVGEPTRPFTVELQRIAPTRGCRAGHAGRDRHPIVASH